MASIRIQRVRELLKQEIGEAIRREFHVTEAGLISVNDVDVAGDLKSAVVFISILGKPPTMPDTTAIHVIGYTLFHYVAFALVGVIVAWPLLARILPTRTVTTADATPDRRALRIGLPIICVLTIGFTLGDTLGVPAWAVALTADLILVAILRRVPWKTLPLTTAAMVLAIGVLSVAATPHLHIDRLLTGSSALDQLKVVAVCAVLAALINNLPAALIVFSTVTPPLRWAALLGVNLGPLLTLHGSLAGLLWQESLSRLNVNITARRYQTISWRAGLPAAVAAALTLEFLTR